MTQEEKQQLHRAHYEVEQILIMLDGGVGTSTSVKQPSFGRLFELLDGLRVYTKYQLLDLEATHRERNALEKALRDKQ